METILLVEDEPINREIMAAWLRQGGYGVDEAEDGQDALRRLEAHPDYALIVTDRRMPNMDGLELAQKMKARPDLQRIPVIMQTGSDKPEEVVEGIVAGVYYYLTKPYKEETLLALVKAGIRERRQQEWFEQRAERHKDAIDTLVKGEFHVRVPEEAQNLAFMLGSLFPRPVMAVSGLYELLLNAIEHGNLAIGYEEKARLLANSIWEKEVAHRLQMPQYAARKVTVEFTQNAEKVEVTITDEGPGFDWLPYLEIEPSRATQSNGRGIAKANLLSFDQIAYLGKGNHVRASARLSSKPVLRRT